MSTFSEEEAAVGVLLAVMCADGEVADEEMAWWKRVQHRHPLFADLPPSLYNPMIDKARRALDERPWRDAISTWSTLVPRHHSRMLFELAVELAFIDQDVSGSEPDVLIHLAHGLGLTADEARQVIRAA